MRTRLVGVVALCLIGALAPAVGAFDDPLCQGLAVTLGGTPANDHLVGTAGPDVIDGRGGDDVIEGRGGADVICGGPGDDVIHGGKGRDLIEGGSGTDMIIAGAGADRVWGGAGADTIRGGDGSDIILGGDDADDIGGQAGADDVRGGPGGDTLRGGAGDDVISGGADGDDCDGGPGVDVASDCEEPRHTEKGDRPSVVTHPGSGSVALTFDDGPDPRWTPQVLDLLAQYRVHATFFVIGYKAARYPDLIARMVREGHSVQNHTHSHAWLTSYSNAGAAAEIATGRDEIAAAALGVEPQCLRPPYGAISDRIRGVAADEHQAVVMWDVDPQDWRYHDSGYIARQVLGHTGSNDVVLLHDGAGVTAANSLPAIIRGLRARGLEFASICG